MIEYNNRECLQICDVHCGENSIDDLRAEVERLTGFINDSRDMVVIDRSSRCEAAEADAKDADRERKRCETSHAKEIATLRAQVTRRDEEISDLRHEIESARDAARGENALRLEAERERDTLRAQVERRVKEIAHLKLARWPKKAERERDDA